VRRPPDRWRSSSVRVGRGYFCSEAVGHGLEADFNRKGTSAFSGLVGQRVASDLCTVVDEGTIPGRRGSLNIDDEGNPTSRTVLIEKGYPPRISAGPSQFAADWRPADRQWTAGKLSSYAHATHDQYLPSRRREHPEEVIRSVSRGLYAVQFGGGQVDITSGKFVFSASEAYLIEDGRITAPVKGATLIGSGPESLTKVTAVGNDPSLDEGVGTCGKGWSVGTGRSGNADDQACRDDRGGTR
jgi:TldD protein